MFSLRDPIAITGTGLACNMGDDDAVVGAVREGSSGRFVEVPVAVELDARCTLAGLYPRELDDGALGVHRRVGRFLGRASRLALITSRVAIERADLDPSQLSVCFGSGTGDVDTHLDIADRLRRKGSMRRIPPTTIPKLMSSTVAANLANVLGAQGGSVTATAACAGGAWNIATGAMLLDSGHAKAVLAGGVEAWDPHFHAGFDSMRAYNSGDNKTPERASRPYAADRAGFIMGEGAGAVVMEPLSAARARGAEVLGLLLGWGMSSDGSGEMVAPDPAGAVRAMRQALEHAGVSPEEIDYVHTHATSTPVGDVSEVGALRTVFAGRHLPYSTTKGITGHTISAAGALGAIFTWAMLREGWLAPSVGAEPLDPALLDYPPLTSTMECRARLALCNAFGFGGTNACLVLGAAA